MALMDRRKEPRLSLGCPGRIACLRPKQEWRSCVVENLSGRGVRVLVNEPLTANMPVQIECRGVLLLAIVCYCQPLASGFAVGAEVDQYLATTSDLLSLTGALQSSSGEGRQNDSPLVPAAAGLNAML